MQNDLFMVADAKEDARFKNNPLVLTAPYIRFYAGVPLVLKGMPLGTWYVIDRESKILRSTERQALRDLGTIATDLIQLRWDEKKTTNQGVLASIDMTGNKPFIPGPAIKNTAESC